MKNRFVAERIADQPVTLMHRLQTMKAGMDDAIDLSLGDPDFVTPAPILEAGYRDALAGYTKYSNVKGYPDVIRSVASYYKRELGLDVPEKRIIVVASGNYAGFLACFSTLDPGDEVLIPDPCFISYKRQIEFSGGIAVPVPTREEDGWQLHPEVLERFVTPKTKAMFINSPCNPTGACMDRKALEKIADFAKAHDLLVISDEIYTWFDFTGGFCSMLQIPGMADRTIIINSMSKNYVATGARIGWMIAPEEIIEAIANEGLYIAFAPPSISQRMAKFALDEGKELMQPILNEFRERMCLAAERINRIPHLHVQDPPQGTFYLFVNIKETGLTSEEFVIKVLEEAHVAVIPGNNFGDAGNGYVRICATVSSETLLEALDRIEALHL